MRASFKDVQRQAGEVEGRLKDKGAEEARQEDQLDALEGGRPAAALVQCADVMQFCSGCMSLAHVGHTADRDKASMLRASPLSSASGG